MRLREMGLKLIPLLVLLVFVYSLAHLFSPMPVLDPLSSEVLHSVRLTLFYSVLALFCSWTLALLFVKLNAEAFFSIFRILWVMPGFAYALIILFALRALDIQDRYSMRSVCFAWILAGVPYLTISIRNALKDLDPREKEALQSLGASPRQTWWHYDFIKTLPSQAGAVLQQFWLYLTSFSLVMILNGGPPNETLEVAIFTSVKLDQVNLGKALSLALWQALILILLRFFLKTKTSTGIEWASPRLGNTKSLRVGYIIFGLFGLFMFFANRSGMILDGFVLALLTSVALALLVSALTVGFSFLCYFSNVRFIAELGAWFSPMVVTLAWWKCFAFTVSPMINCILIQTVLFGPWIARSLFPLLDRKRMPELQAAQSLGADPAKAWFLIEWPRVKSMVIFNLSLLFFLSITEVTTVYLFAKPDFEPLAVWIQNAFFRFKIQEGLFGTLILIYFSYLVLEKGSETA